MDLRQSGSCPAVARGSPSLSRLRRLPIYLQASRSLPAAGPLPSTSSRPATRLPTAQLRSEEPARRRRKLGRPPMTLIRVGRVEEPRSDWRRAVAAVSERRVAEGRALYTERSPAELYREARSSERERYARQASRLGAKRPFPAPVHRGTVPRGTLGCIAWSLRPLVPVIVVSVPWLSHDGRLI